MGYPTDAAVRAYDAAGNRHDGPVKILSIQSSVAYGYVGNSAAVFPLQRLGHEVWDAIFRKKQTA